MKYNYLIVTIKEEGKNWAYVVKNDQSYNLLCDLEIKNIVAANIMPSKKKAEELARYWNKCYRENGTNLY